MERICCFYASDEHLLSILLPYINEKTKENQNVVTILEKNIGKSVGNFKKFLKFSKEDWKKIDNILNEKNVLKKIDTTNIVILAGSENFVKMERNKLKDKETLICCYNFMQTTKNIENILSENDKILSTVGEQDISKMFTEIPNKSYKEITILK
jgi:hypothetical protein